MYLILGTLSLLLGSLNYLNIQNIGIKNYLIIGFSHSFYIFQDDADHSDCNTAWYCPDKKKLSWHLTAYHNNPVKGGFRLGELNINVRLVDNLRKILFLK